ELVQPIDNVTYVVEKRRKIAFPHYSTLASRLDSFNNESHYDYFTKNKQVLAEAGFYSTGYSDSTVCYYCGGGVRDWEEDDDPWQLHSVWFKLCPFVYLMKGKQYADKCLLSKKVLPDSPQSEKKDGFQSIDLRMFFEDENTIEEDDSSQCAICLTSKREILFFPCKHFGTCVECSLRLEKCITCRAPITGMLKIFLV
ncbi:MAG: hypothetical protein E6K54_08690, partial [Gammaproteobacteria bacterium]